MNQTAVSEFGHPSIQIRLEIDYSVVSVSVEPSGASLHSRAGRDCIRTIPAAGWTRGCESNRELSRSPSVFSRCSTSVSLVRTGETPVLQWGNGFRAQRPPEIGGSPSANDATGTEAGATNRASIGLPTRGASGSTSAYPVPVEKLEKLSADNVDNCHRVNVYDYDTMRPLVARRD